MIVLVLHGPFTSSARSRLHGQYRPCGAPRKAPEQSDVTSRQWCYADGPMGQRILVVEDEPAIAESVV